MPDNILNRIPGEYVGGATKGLPELTVLSKEPDRETVLEVPGIGRVRFYCRQRSHKVHRRVEVWWLVYRAEHDAPLQSGNERRGVESTMTTGLPNWFKPLARIAATAASGVFPPAAILVQISSEWESWKTDQRLEKLEDPISNLHPNVRDASREIYDAMSASGDSLIELAEDVQSNYRRPIALLKGAGWLETIDVLGRDLPLRLRLINPVYVLYIAGLYADANAMEKVVARVDQAPVDVWLNGTALANEYRVPEPVVEALLRFYASRGLGLMSEEMNALNYLPTA